MCGTWFFVVGFLALPSCGNSDNIGLLLDTLKVNHREVCNEETVSLACPRGTMISLQVAQYGKASEEQDCPARNKAQTEESRNCKRSYAMQYSLLQTVVEACQKKPQCTFSTKLNPGLVDNCPTQTKYIEVDYKCRPYEFRSRDICDGQFSTISCNPHSRIAIYDAQYGRTKYEASRCQAPGASNETCSAPHAMKTVIQQCLGKRRCQLFASRRTFNFSCQFNTKPYLKVVYACVQLGILAQKYESAAENDETSSTFNYNRSFFNESEDEAEKYKEINTDHVQLPPLDDIPSPTRRNVEETTLHGTQSTVKINERISGLRRYTSTILLLVGIGILVFIFVTGIFFGVRCYINRKINENSKNGDMYTTEAPNVFSDAFSDIDNDADISHISGTFHDPLHPDMILYKNIPGSRGTLRAMKPLCTIYPSPVEASMYGNVDYVSSHTRDPVVLPRFTRSRSNEEEMEPKALTSPRSLGAPSNNYYYG